MPWEVICILSVYNKEECTKKIIIIITIIIIIIIIIIGRAVKDIKIKIWNIHVLKPLGPVFNFSLCNLISHYTIKRLKLLHQGWLCKSRTV